MAKRISIYKLGARIGLPFGLYLALISIFVLNALKVEVLGVASLVMLLLLPVVVYVILRRYYVLENGFPDFSTLWMLGILVFIYGSLICSAVTYVMLQYVEPGLIQEQMTTVLETYRTIPDIDPEVVEVLEKAVEQDILPTPIQYVFQMIWVTTFFGSLLSAFVAMLARIKKVPKIWK